MLTYRLRDQSTGRLTSATNAELLERMAREIGEIGAGIRPAARPVSEPDGELFTVRMVREEHPGETPTPFHVREPSDAGCSPLIDCIWRG